jgi:cob(I)alamin adenosyltransferase
VPKDTPRIEAYGTIDELNAIVGLARTFNEEKLADDTHRSLNKILSNIQQELFDLGAELATPPDWSRGTSHRIGETEIKTLERIMDRCQRELQPLPSFILPGGGRIGAFLHQARTVCRRAEREILRLSRVEAVNDRVIRYVNRLSDVFFVLARWIALRSGEKEYLWEHGLKGKGKNSR